MKYLRINMLRLLIVVIAFSNILCAQNNNGAIAENIDVEKFSKSIEKEGIIILDVRTPQETMQGVIEGAKRINYYSEDFMMQVNKLDKNKPIYIYCASGGRSGGAMHKMNAVGFKEIYNLIGGMNVWRQKGLPTVKP